MKNPYDDIDASPSEITFSKRAAWVMIVVGLLGIVLVPLARHITEFKKPAEERWFPVVEVWKKSGQKTLNQFFQKKSKNPSITREGPNLRDHLQAFEGGIKDSDYRKGIQQSEQQLLSKLYKKGNTKVIRGRDNWLYYRPAVEAMTGRGPLVAEPDSVTKDPDRQIWNDPLVVIDTFHQQLQERGIELMIVPIPVKPMLETDGLGLSSSESSLTHPDHQRFYQTLTDKGIEVVDLLPVFERLRTDHNHERYLRQDTHWRAEIAQAAAAHVGQLVRQKPWYGEVEKYPAPKLVNSQRYGLGDLVEMLGLPEGNSGFEEEKQMIQRVLDSETNRALDGNLFSPISILGDSFINIYEEPGLGFGNPLEDDGLIGAGFGSHLSADLKLRPHIVAINGEGATGVRQAFAALPDNVVRSRKLVIWAIASRDFFLAESAAMRAGVYWQDVDFNPQAEVIEPPIPPVTDTKEEASEYLILSGVLAAKSIIDVEPDKVLYADATYTAVFKDIEVVSGEYYDPEAFTYLWAFQNHQWSASSKIEVGKRYQFKVAPFSKRPAIARKKQFSDGLRFDLDHLFVEEIEEISF